MSKCKSFVWFVACGAPCGVHRGISGAGTSYSGYFGCIMQRRPPAAAHAFSRDAGSISFDVVADSSRDATVAAEGRVFSGPPADAFHWETPSKFPELPVCWAGPGCLPWLCGSRCGQQDYKPQIHVCSCFSAALVWIILQFLVYSTKEPQCQSLQVLRLVGENKWCSRSQSSYTKRNFKVKTPEYATGVTQGNMKNSCTLIFIHLLWCKWINITARDFHVCVPLLLLL